jgi:rhamnosyl/mannosyltransferase
MKVLFLTKYYPPSEGGIERYSHLLCTGLAGQGVHVEVVAAAEKERASRIEVVDGIRVHRVGSLGEVRGVAISPGLTGLMRRLVPDFDLIHLNFPNPWAELNYLAFWGQRKAILTYHSDIFRQKVFSKIYSPLIHRLLHQMSAVIATSPNYVDSSPFLSQYRAQCRIVPLAVDAASLREGAGTEVDAVRGQYGRFVFFAGRLVYYKGLEHLIDAIGQLQDVHLVVVGRGRLEQQYRERARRLGLQERVSFLGKVSDERLKVFYHACQCFVLPSVARSEAFGMVLAEAMACGRPVISTELSTGTSFVNQDGETGFVVPPGDPSALARKIDLLVQDQELQKAMGQKGRRRVEQEFSKEIMIERTLRIYEEVLEGGGAGRH